MSGTSADGITAAAVRFIENGSPAPDLQLLATITREYTNAQRERLLRAGLEQPADALTRLDFELGDWLADAARAVMTVARLRGTDVRAIASHGHTVWHAGARGTWQIGQAAVIAERTGLDVVSDFRVRDAAAGGQGAPLVAIADTLLFAAPDHARALQNIGGIANVSVVPARGGADLVLAFDTGPGCGVIDATVRRLVPSLGYDVDGAMALRGTVIPGPVDAALADPYFAAKPPKSTGREKFSAAYANAFVERCLAADRAARPEDIVATAVSLTARSIGIAYQRFVPPAVEDVLLSGGGANNPALVRAVRDALAPRTVRLFSEEFFDDGAKEAVAFAFLGWLHLERRPGNVPSATGAAGPRVLGKFTPR
jgi:anhydro-N-acetylmuramic acid kinase